ncbi:ATP-dependent DNA helicase PIF1-like [Haemaphysalis longicornis]
MRKREDIMDTEKFCDLMRLTNSEQHQFLRELIHRQTTLEAEPLRAFFTGHAGCGKTFILKLAIDIYSRFNPDPPYIFYVICASTGKAAVAVGGTTMHSAFKLSPSRTNDGGLRESELNTLTMAFRNLRCVIIDETSMMTAYQLDAIDMRLRHVTQMYNEPFGGVDMILCGGLWQLPPPRPCQRHL